MKKCPWKKIDEFYDYTEFERFLLWMKSLEEEGIAKEKEVVIPYKGISSFTEKWYQHIESKENWRLVFPDPPFKGLFEKV